MLNISVHRLSPITPLRVLFSPRPIYRYLSTASRQNNLGFRINTDVRPKSGSIRVIDACGTNRGIMPVFQGIEVARKQNLDLVQVSDVEESLENSEIIPVCKVLDAKKFAFEQSKKAEVLKKKAREVDRLSTIKEVQFGTSIAENDMQMKFRRLETFLSKGHMTRVAIMFRRSKEFNPTERVKRAFLILDKCKECAMPYGIETEIQRKVLKNAIRTVFTPSKRP